MTDNALRVGDRLHTAAEYDRLPVGTVVGPTHSSNDSYTKQSDGLYLSKRYGTAVSVSDFEMDGYNSIKELGSGLPALDSLIQWQWRFRDNAYQSAEQAGVHRETVDKAMADLHLTDDMFPLGAGVKLASDRNKDLLPIGSVVVQGEPERLADFDDWRAGATEAADMDPHDCRVANYYVRRFNLGLRAPDALHAAICRRLELRLVTLDRRLAAAAMELGIDVMVPEQ